MANAFTTQIIVDGPRNAVVKLTGILDTSNLAITTAIDLSTLTQGGTQPQPTAVCIHQIEYTITGQLEVQLLWNATTDVVIIALAHGQADFKFKNFGGLQNNAGAGKNGNIDILTTGWASGTQTFSIVLTMVKQ